ncbi:MAG: FHA domain-containing protein [Deltaproteobacteria bacterium]|nr:FHA domain-containing protein [Deltaproteobacteria bacterium]
MASPKKITPNTPVSRRRETNDYADGVRRDQAAEADQGGRGSDGGDGGDRGKRRAVRLISAKEPTDLSIDLQVGLNRIGRQRIDNEIVLVSPQVSRRHAQIEVSPDHRVVLRDLGSANGTLLNGHRISGEQPVHSGDVLSFSDQFSFRLQITTVEDPSRMMLKSRGAVGETSLPARPLVDTHGPLLSSDSIPRSLEERNERVMAEDSHSGLAAPSGAKIQPPTHVGKPPTAQVDQLRPRGIKDTGTSVDHERQQLASLFQISKQCMRAESLVELDRLLIDAMSGNISFSRAFIAYQVPTGDWKLVISPRGYNWDRHLVRDLLQLSLTTDKPLVVADSMTDSTLGGDGQRDARLLVPLRTDDGPIGTIFLLHSTPFAPATVDFLSLLSDIAALAIANCSRTDRRL